MCLIFYGPNCVGIQFAQLEMDLDVDDDLKLLKKDLLGSSSTTAQVYS